MIAVISLLVPPLILVYLREKMIGRHTLALNAVFYAFSLLGLNFVMLVVLYWMFGSKREVCYRLNTYNEFAVKYMLLSVALAIAEPCAEKYLRENVTVKFGGGVFWAGRIKCNWRLLAAVYAAVLFLLNFIRIFDDNFWYDETFTIHLVRLDLPDVIRGTAEDVHPPLYYLIVKAAYGIFGGHGWLFHFVSLIPCAVILILAMSHFWDRFGGEAAALLVTAACLSPNAVRFNVEVRMYSWGALFVLMGFYELYNVMAEGKIRDYVLFAAFSLAAAYTHYYCLVSVGFFYVVLLVLAVAGKADRKKVFWACAGTAAGYLPWFFALVKTLVARSEYYWITDIPTFWESLNYLFSNRFRPAVWGMLALGMLFASLYETGMLAVQKGEGGKIRISVSLENRVFSPVLVWLVAGICSVLGTICVGIGISMAVRPFYLLRYIYPVSVVAWMCLGIIISRLKGKKLYVLLLLAYMIIAFLPAYWTRFTDERGKNERLNETLAVSKSEIQGGDIILSSDYLRLVYVYGLYYSGITLQHFDSGTPPVLDGGKRYWWFAETDQGVDGLWPEEQGFSCEKFVDKGNIGTTDVYIYRIEKQGGMEGTP